MGRRPILFRRGIMMFTGLFAKLRSCMRRLTPLRGLIRRNCGEVRFSLLGATEREKHLAAGLVLLVTQHLQDLGYDVSIILNDDD